MQDSWPMSRLSRYNSRRYLSGGTKMKHLIHTSLLLLTGLMLLAAQPARAAVVNQTVEYNSGTTGCEGYFAWDDAISGPRPAILVVHQYRGAGDYEHKRADMLAGLGYLAFVC